MKKDVKITKEVLDKKFKELCDRQLKVQEEVERLGIMFNKLEGAKEVLQLLYKDLESDEHENKEDTKE